MQRTGEFQFLENLFLFFQKTRRYITTRMQQKLIESCLYVVALTSHKRVHNEIMRSFTKISAHQLTSLSAQADFQLI